MKMIIIIIIIVVDIVGIDNSYTSLFTLKAHWYMFIRHCNGVEYRPTDSDEQTFHLYDESQIGRVQSLYENSPRRSAYMFN